MILTLDRTYHPLATTGLLMTGGLGLETLERPWVDNQGFVSCIPEGVYTFRRDLTGKHRVFRIDDRQVAPRFAIEMHPVEPACRVEHLQGCICPGELDWELEPEHPFPVPTILGSRHACDMLIDALSGSETHTLWIRTYRPTGVRAA